MFEYKSMTASSVVVDEGIFSAIISTSDVDLQRDVVRPEAILDALGRWATVDRDLPLHWAHSAAPEDIVGAVDPSTARKRGNQVVVDGWVDQSTPRGREIWRLIKSGTVGFSYGFSIQGAGKRDDGVREIAGLHLFEVSVTPAPANPGTGVVSWKSLDPPVSTAPALPDTADVAGGIADPLRARLAWTLEANDR